MHVHVHMQINTMLCAVTANLDVSLGLLCAKFLYICDKFSDY